MIKLLRLLPVPLVSVSAAFFLMAAGPVRGIAADTAASTAGNRATDTRESASGTPASPPSDGPAGGIAGRPTAGPAKTGGRSRKEGAVALSAYAEELARSIGFDRRVLVIVKEETGERIQRLVGYDAAGYQIVAPGIAVPVPENGSERVLASLRKKLAPLGYLAFAAEMNDALRIDKIGVLKGRDRYDILRVMHTSGRKYDLKNRDVISQLKSWERICSFTIIGADNDWVEIEFRTLPKNLKDFAGEVYDFSPDAVDQGPGTVEGLMREMKNTKRLLLWWDE